MLALLTLASIQAPIAAERDRKSLDSLLATPLTSAEIVLQTFQTGLCRYANVVGATLPVIVLMMFLGGIDVWLVLLAVGGLLAMAFAIVALSVAASVESRNAANGRALASLFLTSWLIAPFMFIMLKPRLWPGGPRWLVTCAFWLLGTSPLGVAFNLIGFLSPGSVVDATLRMIGWELLGGSALLAWAIWRLRPASRALHDAEGQLAMSRILRATLRRRPRSACGDDPVFWNAIHANRAVTRAAYLVNRGLTIVYIGLLAWVTPWFASPAFAELGRSGYGARPEAFTMPDLNPIARVIVNKLESVPVAPAAGQARLEFNIALRQFSTIVIVFYAFALVAAAADSIIAERERGTWLGLIATPLSGWEILRAKMLGPIWRTRGCILLIVGLWVLGSLAGSVHPFGLLASLASLLVIAGFSTAVGVTASLRARERGSESVIALLPFLLMLSGLAVVLPGFAGVYLAAGSSAYLPIWSLWTYEDIHALVHSGAYPLLGASNGLKPGASARLVMLAWLIGTTVMAGLTVILVRSSSRGFDALVGRPSRRPARAGWDGKRSSFDFQPLGPCDATAPAAAASVA
jgi:ABC-type transport system involved in multi-copper enzyme maturation permease subunit